MKFSNAVYDRLKFLVQIVLPGFGAMYYALDKIWNWGNADNITGSITAICVFLGLCLGLSSSNYRKSTETETTDAALGEAVGVIQIDTSEASKDVFSLVLNGDPHEMVNKQYVTFAIDAVKANPR